MMPRRGHWRAGHIRGTNPLNDFVEAACKGADGQQRWSLPVLPVRLRLLTARPERAQRARPKPPPGQRQQGEEAEGEEWG